jgi:cytochrome c oxidase subunit II
VLRTITLLAGVLAMSLVLTACPDDAVTEVDVLGTDGLRFQPDEYVVPAGEQVTVQLTAEEGNPHDFTIEETGDEVVVQVDAGETATGTLTVDEPGTYTVYCGVPGHRDAGMLATLEVTG